MDPRALAIRSVDYCRHPDEIVIEPRITRQMFDGVGRQVASWDPRLWGTASQPNLSAVYGLSGQPVLTDSVDAGWQLSVLNHTGSLNWFWDGRGNQRGCVYDDQQRPVAVTEQSSGALPKVVDRFTYGGADVVDAERNQCGRLIRHDNPASSQIIKEYGLAGAVLVESSSYLLELEPPDWPLDLDARDEWLEDEVFTTRHSFRPTGEIECLTDAMGNVRTFGYDVSGKLNEAWLTSAGEGKPSQRLVFDIRYNALDQIESETAGNGVVTRADYAADDGRLVRLVAAVGSQTPLQDLNYVYDAVGNIVELEDKSQPVSHFNNQRIDPINRYRYDSLYQLIEASGWEVANPSHGPALPELLPTPLDPNQRRNYTQRFDYDAAGNLITRHHSGAPGFSMFTSARSNRSLAQRVDGSLPGEPDIDSGFDACGNQIELQRGQVMHWDARNQLSRVTLVKRKAQPDDDECYFYDRPGHRVRKVNVSQTINRTLRSEVRYLHSLEIHRHADGEEHHVISTEAGRSSVRALHWPNGARADQLRYYFCDHLRSSTLELDADAGVLTWERYYPFGGTACWAGKSALVAKYKTIRYSGKERDSTGLYYYGYRYFASWLQRWTGPDPEGETDGLNLYCFVGNSPAAHLDREGLMKIKIDENDNVLLSAVEGSKEEEVSLEVPRYVPREGSEGPLPRACLPSGAIELGDHFYLFQKAPGVPAKRLIISAHAFYYPYASTRVPVSSKLIFYGPHGKSLEDPGLGNVMRGEVEPYEILESGARVSNYSLFKYSRDNYASVRFGVDLENVDVMTVRNRKQLGLLLKNGTISLGDAFKALKQNNINYEEIHFVACRNFVLRVMPPTHTVSKISRSLQAPGN